MRQAGLRWFLDLDYEPPVAEGYGNREGIQERELAWKARALDPIRAERTGNWRRELSGRQIQWLEHLDGRELTRVCAGRRKPKPFQPCVGNRVDQG
jgi:hypothetical protein